MKKIKLTKYDESTQFLLTQLAYFCFFLGQKVEKDVIDLVTPSTMPPPSI